MRMRWLGLPPPLLPPLQRQGTTGRTRAHVNREVAVEICSRQPSPQRRDGLRPERPVAAAGRAPVKHVDVQPVGARGQRALCVVSQSRKVGREDRGGDQRGGRRGCWRRVRHGHVPALASGRSARSRRRCGAPGLARAVPLCAAANAGAAHVEVEERPQRWVEAAVAQGEQAAVDLVARRVGVDGARHSDHGGDAARDILVQARCDGSQDGAAQGRGVGHPGCKGGRGCGGRLACVCSAVVCYEPRAVWAHMAPTLRDPSSSHSVRCSGRLDTSAWIWSHRSLRVAPPATVRLSGLGDGMGNDVALKICVLALTDEP
jgi:hypothetical protein